MDHLAMTTFAFIFTSILCGLPIIIVFEILYLITNPEEIHSPYILSLPLSFLISIVIAFGLLSGAKGEGGFGVILFTPYIIISSLLVGFLVSYFYKVRKRPIIPRSLKAWIIATLILFLVLSPIFIHLELPHTGVILESESNKPIPQVLVRQTLDYECMLSFPPVGNSKKLMGYTETFSDKDGEYFLPLQFYFKYPYLCWGEDDTLELVKAGYFARDTPTSTNPITLFSANHLLDFNKTTKSYHFTPKKYTDEIAERSVLTEKAIHAAKNVYPLPDGEVGVFLSAPGRQFTKLYRSFDNDVYGREIFYAFDENSNTWFAFDKRGMPLEDKHAITRNLLGSKINKQNYDQVSDFFDSEYQEVFTIEGNRRVVCKYSRKEINFCFKTSDLPQSGNDDTLSTAQFFGFLRNSSGGRQGVVAKTDKFTHFYDIAYRRAGTKYIWQIKEREDLLSDNDITAVATDKLLLGFSDGMISSVSSKRSDKTLKFEDFSFNISDLNIKSIKSLLWSSDLLFLYVTDGTDKIYRFNKSGSYDFKVNAIEEPLNEIIIEDVDSRYLFRAIRNADHKLLEILLKSGTDPNIKDRNGDTPLILASRKGDYKLLEILLDSGADPNVKDINGYTPLYFLGRHSPSVSNTARRKIYLEMIDLMLNHGADPSIKDENGELMFGFIHVQGNLDIIKTLIEKSTDPDALYRDGENQLFSCVKRDRSTDTTPCVDFLLSVGVDPNKKNTVGKYPLWIAVEQMDLRMVRFFLENGADAKIINEDGQTLLWAILSTSSPHPNDRRKTEILELLFANGVQLDTRDNNGDTILSWAEKFNQGDIVDLLLSLGKKYSQLNVLVQQGDIKFIQSLFDGNNPPEKETIDYAFFNAVAGGRKDVVELLLKKGADPNCQNESKQTCLWEIADTTDVEMLELMLKYGAKPDVVDNKGETVLWKLIRMRAKKRLSSNQTKNNYTIVYHGKGKGTIRSSDVTEYFSPVEEIKFVKMLIDNGLDPFLKNKYGATAFFSAKVAKNRTLVEFLSKYEE